MLEDFHLRALHKNATLLPERRVKFVLVLWEPMLCTELQLHIDVIVCFSLDKCAFLHF